MTARTDAPPDPVAAPGQSITRQTLRKIALRISIVVALATVLSYWHVRASFEQQALEVLERYVEQRRVRESAIFNLASGNLRTFSDTYLREIRQTDPRDAEQRFAALFETRQDGTTRLTENVFRIYGMTGFIGKNVIVDRDLKRRLVAAFDLVKQFGPAWASQFTNLYVVTPEGAVIMYWPGQPWALKASDWEISGKLGLLSESHDGIVVAGEKVSQPTGKERWSELYFDYGTNDWLVSVTRSVADSGHPLVQVGQDILMQDVLGRTVSADLKGTHNLLFSNDGRLIAHPRFMDAIQARNGSLPIDETGDAHLAQIHRMALERPSDQFVLRNEPYNEIVAITKISGPEWNLATIYPLSLAAADAWKAARIVLLMGAAALLIELFILSSTLRTQIATPLRQLVRAAGSVAEGRFDTKLDLHRNDELGELAEAFTAMVRQVDAREMALKERGASLAELNEQLAHELAERERAERELADHRELNALLDTIDYGILFLDPNLKVRLANRAYKEIWALPDALVAKGTPISHVMSHIRSTPASGSERLLVGAEDDVERVCRSDGDIVEVVNPDGRILNYQCIALPDGGRMLTYLDVTDQKRALDAVAAAEQRQRRLLEIAPFPLAATRLSDGIILYANARTAEMIGLPPEHVQGTPAPDYYARPEDRIRILERLSQDGRVSDVEVLMKRPDGEQFWALINSAVVDYEGTPALLAAFNDISELKRREEQLKIAKKETDAALRDLNAVLQTIQYGVLFLDPDLRIRLANRAYCQLWQMPAEFYNHPRHLEEDMEESRAMGAYNVPDSEWAAYKERRIAEIAQGNIPPVEMRLRNGRTLQYRCIALPDGGRMLTYFDITELKWIEEALRDAKQHAEDANRAKSQFLANMSHELRTPLNAVLGYTELLMDGLYGTLPGKAQAVLGRVEANGRHLLSLINDVLDLSKIEAGEFSMNRELYSVPGLIQTAMTVMEPLAKAKSLELRMIVPDRLPVGYGDERRLMQVLLNLIGNAIKFTQTGSIEITAEAADNLLKISVADTGIGISPEDQKVIFGAFYQGSNAAAPEHGGTGLGLAISKRIVEMHGGSLRVSSDIGHGSTFIIELPLEFASMSKEVA